MRQPTSSVLVICGSESDIPRLQAGLELLGTLGIAWELRALSAHRSPAEATAVASAASTAGHRAIIAAAGLSAHLPGVVAAHTSLPVIGLPIAAGPLAGSDALHSIVQMPPGVPVLTVGIDNARNAALAAARILAIADPAVADALARWTRDQHERVLAADERARTRSTAPVTAGGTDPAETTTRKPAHA